MTKPRAGQSGNWDRERADRLQEDVERMQKDVERLERWKAEATEVMSGLRELGKALGLGLGVQITGPAALAEVARLTAERDALAQIKRHIDEVRNGTGWTVQIYGVLLQQCDQYGKTIDTRRAERAEAERDALAAQVARAEALAGQWERLATTAINPDSREWLQACAETLRECLSGWPKMSAALADSEADTTDTHLTDPGCGCSTNLARDRYADGDPAGCYCTCSDDAREGCEHDPDEHQPTDQEADK
jgi:hypothetical protein